MFIISNTQKEIEKLKDETERRLLVKKEKHLGREIEKIEKSRIAPDIISIHQRITELGGTMIDMSKGIQESQPDPNFPIGPDTREMIKSFVKNYISIRKDICYTIEKKEKTFPDKFENIFPEIKTSTNTYREASTTLLTYAEQLLQIRTYLNRYLL